MHKDKIHNGNEKTLNNSQYPSTSQIILNTLQAIGCQPELNDDTTIHVLYQGENFEFNFNDSRYTRVWDPYWTSIKQDNPDFHLIKEAVRANFHNLNEKQAEKLKNRRPIGFQKTS